MDTIRWVGVVSICTASAKTAMASAVRLGLEKSSIKKLPL
jgi:hypothetical protein